MIRIVLIFIILMFVIMGSGCGEKSELESSITEQVPTVPSETVTEPSATATSKPTITVPTSTKTPIPATNTPTLTSTPLPATYTPIPPTPTMGSVTNRVCVKGCDFTTIQTALEDDSTLDGAVIEVGDAIHTEANISISKNVTIRGLGAENTIIQAGESLEDAQERVFLIERGAEVTLSGITIRHGKPSMADECGGGIRNYGTLTVDSSIITANTANGGAGICNNSELTVINSSIHGNIAHENASRGLECGSGAAIKSGGKSLLVMNSVVYDNQAGAGGLGRDRGGGIHVGCGCTGTIINTTISSNKSAENGGGLYVAGNLHLINSTVTENRAAGRGGGIYVLGTVNMENTIIANNSGNGGNCVLGQRDDTGKKGAIELNRHNLISDGTCSPEIEDDPRLGPLQDNGGITFTHALLEGSPAIDVIPINDCQSSYDQRWLKRPATLISEESLCDIGAYEVQNTESGSTASDIDSAMVSVDPLRDALRLLFYEDFEVSLGDWERPYGILRYTTSDFNNAPGAALLVSSEPSGSMDYHGAFGRCFDLREILMDWPEVEGQKFIAIETYLKTDDQIGSVTLNAMFSDDSLCGTGHLGSIKPQTIPGDMDWVKLFSVTTIPAGTQSLHFFLSATSLSDEANVYIDDIRIYAPETLP